jgi:hypothetical protein
MTPKSPLRQERSIGRPSYHLLNSAEATPKAETLKILTFFVPWPIQVPLTSPATDF